MALKKKGGWWHGDTPADLASYLLKHVLGRHCRGVPHRVAHAQCTKCSAAKFDLFTDDAERVLRVCTACEAEHEVCDPDKKCDAKSASEIVCECMYSECEVAVGFALMDDDSVGHLYVAARCTECGRCAVASEWSPKGEFLFAEMANSV
ncbi:MAG: hypothetical protein K2W96_19385 [Gemmataceae bacterium]|nr:hypothetical protein [Gemmataceae bacterium]